MRRLLRHFRALFKVGPGGPAVWAGLRAALATVLPLALGLLLGVPEAGWAGLAGLLVTLADKGGPYDKRARGMGTLTLLGAAVGMLAAPAGADPWVDAGLMLLGVTAASFARAYGETAGGIAGSLSVIFVVSLGAPAAGLEAASTRGLALLLGGLWATTLSLLLWPLRPYLPARRAVARVYTQLAEAAGELGLRTWQGAAPEVWMEAMTRHAPPLRSRIEEARSALGATRLGLAQQGKRGEHLVVLLELAEPMAAVLASLGEAMQVLSRDPRYRPARERVEALCNAYAAMARWVARVLPADRNEGMPRVRDAELPLARKLLSRPRPVGYGRARPIREQEAPAPAHVEELLGKLREYAGVAHETAAGLHHGDAVSGRGRRSVTPPRLERRPLLAPLRDHLKRDSLVLRHALRVGLVATATLLLTRALQWGDAHWVTLAVIGILQPYSASTEERALQRVAGILLGASLAALIATWVHSAPALIGVIALLTATSVALLPLNFGAFQVLLTPDYLLLATLGVGNEDLALQRILGVALACGLSLLGAWLLWPLPERRLFPDAAAATLRSNAHYLVRVAEQRSGTAPQVNEARRSCSLALLEAEASFERLLAEYHGPASQLEPGMALLTYGRRLSFAVTALGAERPDVHAPGALKPLAHQARDALETLADALSRRRAPPPLPSLPLPRTEDPVFAALVERLPRQLGILHGAVARLSSGGALG
jgi:uncharacterized membrane protein YccC